MVRVFQARQELGPRLLRRAMGDDPRPLEPASPLPLLLMSADAAVFSLAACWAVLLEEAAGLPSLLVYGLDGVISSLSPGLTAVVPKLGPAVFDHVEGRVFEAPSEAEG